MALGRNALARGVAAIVVALSLGLAVGVGAAFATTAPPVLLAPVASSSHSSPLSIEYELPEAGSAGTITFAEGTTTVSLTLTSPALAAGKHHFLIETQALKSETANVAAASSTSLPDGEYAVVLAYQNAKADPAATATANKVRIKTATGAPTLSEPEAGDVFRAEPVLVKYTLPEAALPGSVEVELIGAHSGPYTLTLSQSTAGTHTVEIEPLDPGASKGVTSAAPTGKLPKDSYTVVLSYRDSLANPAAAASVAKVFVSYAPCEVGTYGAGGEEPCIKAPKGYFVATKGAEAALECTAGHFAPEEGMNVCEPAQPGSYVPFPGSSFQIECEEGTYQEAVGEMVCDWATPGHWAGRGSAFQTACAAGRFNPHGNAPSVEYCELDPAGTYSGEGAANATPCAAGSYAASTGSSSCAVAGPGSYVDTEGASGEKPCPAGSFAAASGSVSCTETPEGTFATGGAAAATPCPSGTSSGRGASSCVAAAVVGSVAPTHSGQGGAGASPGGIAPSAVAPLAGLSVKVAAGKHTVSLGKKKLQRVLLTCSTAATVKVQVVAAIGAGKKHLSVSASASMVRCVAGKASEAALRFKLGKAARALLAKHGATVKLAVRVYLTGASAGKLAAGTSLQGHA